MEQHGDRHSGIQPGQTTDPQREPDPAVTGESSERVPRQSRTKLQGDESAVTETSGPHPLVYNE